MIAIRIHIRRRPFATKNFMERNVYHGTNKNTFFHANCLYDSRRECGMLSHCLSVRKRLKISNHIQSAGCVVVE